MKSYHRKLLTIITESLLEARLCGTLDELGAHGYTVVDARGWGSRGIRDAGWASSGNIRVEVVCDDDLADRIARRLREEYYDDYAMILYIGDVRVLRADKF